MMNGGGYWMMDREAALRAVQVLSSDACLPGDSGLYPKEYGHVYSSEILLCCLLHWLLRRL